MIASCAFSRSASSVRPPFSNASIESRRIFTWRFSTSLIAASSSRSGACSASHVARAASSNPLAVSSSIAATRRASSSVRIAARTKRSVSRRMSSRALTAVTASRSSWAFRAGACCGALALATLRFLALASGCRALVVLAPAGLREDPSLLDLLVETAEGRLGRLTLADDHFRHAGFQVTPRSVLHSAARAPRTVAGCRALGRRPRDPRGGGLAPVRLPVRGGDLDPAGPRGSLGGGRTPPEPGRRAPARLAPLFGGFGRGLVGEGGNGARRGRRPR